MRISQIPFSQKAPIDCRQYYTGAEGVVQTFNFADNGRHLANQNYRICIRQETGMCSIIYQPCDDRSFAIGRLYPRRRNTTTTTAAPQSAATLALTAAPTTSASSTTETPQTTTLRAATTTAAADDLVDGSGDGTPTREEPDFMALFRNTIFDFRSNKRNARNLYTRCNDRITMPCIIEDFIAPGKGPLPGCEPVHCGRSFCASGTTPCRIESTVTPFYLGVRFGNGRRKGSPEENIGACLRYSQMECL